MTLLTPWHWLASVISFVLRGSPLVWSLQQAAAPRVGHSVTHFRVTCHLCASPVRHADGSHHLGQWLGSAQQASWVPWPALAVAAPSPALLVAPVSQVAQASGIYLGQSLLEAMPVSSCSWIQTPLSLWKACKRHSLQTFYSKFFLLSE